MLIFIYINIEIIYDNYHWYIIDIDTKHGPITNLDKKITAMSKKLVGRHVKNLWRHCNFSDLWAIWSNPKAGFQTHKKLTCKTCKTPVKLIFSLIVAFIKQKLKAELKNLKNTALILLLWVKVLFLQKMLIFAKNGDISKIKEVLVLKGMFFKNAYFERKFLKCLRKLTWVGSNDLNFFEKWMLWVVRFWGADNVFLTIWISFALNFYYYIQIQYACFRKCQVYLTPQRC